MENPPFWWYLLRELKIFQCYVSLQAGCSWVFDFRLCFYWYMYSSLSAMGCVDDDSCVELFLHIFLLVECLHFRWARYVELVLLEHSFGRVKQTNLEFCLAFLKSHALESFHAVSFHHTFLHTWHLAQVFKTLRWPSRRRRPLHRTRFSTTKKLGS